MAGFYYFYEVLGMCGVGPGRGVEATEMNSSEFKVSQQRHVPPALRIIIEQVR